MAETTAVAEVDPNEILSEMGGESAGDQSGPKFTLELKNSGNAAHTFTISKLNVDKEIQPADEGEVDITFPASGQLEFVCKFHESSGMVGLLETSGSPSASTSTSSSKY